MTGFKVFTRGKWTGSEEVYKSVLLLEGTHGLFSVGLRALIVEQAAKDKDKDQEKGTASADASSNAIVSLEGNAALPSSAQDWQKVTRGWLNAAERWLDSQTGFIGVAVLEKVSEGRRLSLRRMLRVCSYKWESNERRKGSKLGSRDFQCALAANKWFTEPAVTFFMLRVPPPAHPLERHRDCRSFPAVPYVEWLPVVSARRLGGSLGPSWGCAGGPNGASLTPSGAFVNPCLALGFCLASIGGT
eukprot:171514-Pyramimonas_sp.AAC.1